MKKNQPQTTVIAYRMISPRFLGILVIVKPKLMKIILRIIKAANYIVPHDIILAP